MRLFGSVAYSWHGEMQAAHASPPGDRSPAVIITLDARWVAVGRMLGGTQLVAWEWIRSLSGWSPLTTELQQDSASDAEPHVSRENTGSAGVERPMRRPIGGRDDG